MHGNHEERFVVAWPGQHGHVDVEVNGGAQDGNELRSVGGGGQVLNRSGPAKAVDAGRQIFEEHVPTGRVPGGVGVFETAESDAQIGGGDAVPDLRGLSELSQHGAEVVVRGVFQRSAFGDKDGGGLVGEGGEVEFFGDGGGSAGLVDVVDEVVVSGGGQSGQSEGEEGGGDNAAEDASTCLPYRKIHLITPAPMRVFRSESRIRMA